MIVRVVTPPLPIVTWAEAQMHLRVDDEEQPYVEALISAATVWIDGPAGWLGRCVGEQTLELLAPAFGCDPLPYPPTIDVLGIGFTASDGSEQELDQSAYLLQADGRLVPAPGTSWPALASNAEAVRVQYVAGYEEPPAPIKQAILLLIGHWYRNRESVVTGTITTSLPLAVEALLSTYRVWSV